MTLPSRKFAAVVFVLAAAAPVVAVSPAWAETMRDKQWYLQTLDVAAAQKITAGDGVVVAVLDTGVGAHPDLDGQILDGTSYIGEPGSFRTDNDGHGSSMAGVIAAKGGNADHLLGIAPKSKILPVRIASSRSQMGPTNIPEGIRWSVDHGAKVINLSTGGTVIDRTAEDAVRYALDHDVVIVAGSGNTSQFPAGSGVIAPARFPGVVAVSAIDRDGKAWDGAIRGPEVVLSAPGVAIPLVSASGGNRVVGYYPTANGTSIATAVVSGAAALIRAKYPQLPAKDVIQRLISTADDAGPPGRDPDYGYGRLNLVKALTADVAPVATNPLLAASPTATPVEAGKGLGDRVNLLVVVAGAGFLVLLVAALGGWLLLRRR
ncbi:S8 family serine peptidase [Dactylosporangium sp. NBC_01737]|uniref:S8 family serine peptidase n=1 Tax=Dactylosporangium sp. NBC_01737 TaxID=2975959 RepID=UPI002E143DDB|nr:S8 family serine peptidase [Dactylosporangium sp. NBC_01737]